MARRKPPEPKYEPLSQSDLMLVALALATYGEYISPYDVAKAQALLQSGSGYIYVVAENDGDLYLTTDSNNIPVNRTSVRRMSIDDFIRIAKGKDVKRKRKTRTKGNGEEPEDEGYRMVQI